MLSSELIELVNDSDFYIRAKSMEVICKNYVCYLREDHNSLLWKQIFKSIQDEKDVEVLNHIFRSLRNILIETIEYENGYICSELKNKNVIKETEKNDVFVNNSMSLYNEFSNISFVSVSDDSSKINYNSKYNMYEFKHEERMKIEKNKNFLCFR